MCQVDDSKKTLKEYVEELTNLLAKEIENSKPANNNNTPRIRDDPVDFNWDLEDDLKNFVKNVETQETETKICEGIKTENKMLVRSGPSDSSDEKQKTENGESPLLKKSLVGEESVKKCLGEEEPVKKSSNSSLNDRANDEIVIKTINKGEDDQNGKPEKKKVAGKRKSRSRKKRSKKWKVIKQPVSKRLRKKAKNFVEQKFQRRRNKSGNDRLRRTLLRNRDVDGKFKKISDIFLERLKRKRKISHEHSGKQVDLIVKGTAMKMNVERDTSSNTSNGYVAIEELKIVENKYPCELGETKDSSSSTSSDIRSHSKKKSPSTGPSEAALIKPNDDYEDFKIKIKEEADEIVEQRKPKLRRIKTRNSTFNTQSDEDFNERRTPEVKIEQRCADLNSSVRKSFRKLAKKPEKFYNEKKLFDSSLEIIKRNSGRFARKKVKRNV